MLKKSLSPNVHRSTDKLKLLNRFQLITLTLLHRNQYLEADSAQPVISFPALTLTIMAPTSTLSFKCAVITGGYSGLGLAMAKSLIKQGKKVILVGRSGDKAKSTAKEIGALDSYTLDTGDIRNISDFVALVINQHPEVDCLINNAGVQRPFQVLGPDYDFDLNEADQEIDINIRGPMHLTLGFLKHLDKLGNGGVIMNVSSVLGYNPTSVVNPVYNGTKAWVHFFSTNIRTQLAQAGSKVKVVEIVPPTVETDLHRERKDPDDNKKSKGNKAAMTVDEFIADVEEGWKQNKDVIPAGMGKELVKRWYDAYGESYQKATGGS